MHGWHLGALTPDQAAKVALPSVSGAAGLNQAAYNVILASVNAGQMLDLTGSPAYIPGTKDCAAIGGVTGPSNLQLIQQGTGLALQGAELGASIAGALSTVVPFVAPIAGIIGIFGIFSAHHAQAVRAEQSALCAAVPAANNYLQVIYQAVQNGHATPQQGIAALKSLLSDFQSQVGSIEKNTPSSCNAACVMYKELQAIVAEVSSQYQDAIDAASGGPTAIAPQPGTVAQPPSTSTPVQSATPARPNTVALPGGTPTQNSYASFYSPSGAPAVPAANEWLPIAAVALAAFFFVRSL